MNFSREDVLSIVDACFHAYASSYRTEAKEDAEKMMDRWDAQRRTASARLTQREAELVEALEKIATECDHTAPERLYMKRIARDVLANHNKGEIK